MNTFERAVEATADIAGHSQPGKQALGPAAGALSLADTRGLEGSVDIDKATRHLYPHDSRWDYAIGYNGRAYFLEMHPASTGNVREMINKVVWLKKWLAVKAPELKKLHGDGRYHWLATGSIRIAAGSPQMRQLNQHGLKPESRIKIG